MLIAADFSTDSSETDSHLLHRALVSWAASETPREQAVVAALVQEVGLLERAEVQAALLHREGDTVVSCDWQALAHEMRQIHLEDEELLFLRFLLSIVLPHTYVAWTRLRGLTERHLGILLRTMLLLSGNTTLAVGTRI